MARYQDVKALLDKLKPQLVDSVKQSLVDGGEIIAKEAKDRAPVKTGDLKKSIHVEASEEGTVVWIKADAKHKGYGYAGIVEFSPIINKPFLYPAADAKAKEVKTVVRNAIKEALANV